eukprot:jgi/Bigna1/132771/aug1.19_g7479
MSTAANSEPPAKKRKWGVPNPSPQAAAMPVDSKAKAAEAIARINAMFKQKQQQSGVAAAPAMGIKDRLDKAASTAAKINAMYSKSQSVLAQGDSNTVKVDINDCSTVARVQLTRSTCHRDLEQKHKVTIAVRGRYIAPGTPNLSGEEKLHLLIRGPNSISVQTAKQVVEQIKARHNNPSGGGHTNTHQTPPSFRPPPAIQRTVAPTGAPLAAAPRNPWAWGTGVASTPLSNVPITHFTQKGLVNAGVAVNAGPVMGANEARGLAFGLHRQDFTRKKTIKLLVGVEFHVQNDEMYDVLKVKLADGFPLVEKITGVQNSFFVHIMQYCPGTLLTLHGQGSNNGGNEALHIRIFGKVDDNLTRAKKMADDLVSNVRKQFKVVFKAYKKEKLEKARMLSTAARVPTAAAASAPWAALAAGGGGGGAPAPAPLPTHSTPIPPSSSSSTIAGGAVAAPPPPASTTTVAATAEDEYDPLAAGSDSD